MSRRDEILDDVAKAMGLSEDVHVYPTFGRPHDVERSCWCKPVELAPNLWLHTFRELA